VDKVLKVHKEVEVLQELKDQLEDKVHKELKVLEEAKEHKVLVEAKVRRVHKEVEVL